MQAQQQKVDVPNLKNIKKKANSTEYTTLLKRFLDRDTMLTSKDYQLLYYGQAYRAGFSGYSSNMWMDSLKREDAKENPSYGLLLEFANKAIEKNPFLGEAWLYKGFMEDSIVSKQEAKLSLNNYMQLVDCIFYSGEGTKKLPYFVVRIEDEYMMMRVFSLRVKQQSLLIYKKSKLDMLLGLSKSGEESQVYFNIDLFYGKFW